MRLALDTDKDFFRITLAVMSMTARASLARHGMEPVPEPIVLQFLQEALSLAPQDICSPA